MSQYPADDYSCLDAAVAAEAEKRRCRSRLAQAVKAARGHADPVRDIPMLNAVARTLIGSATREASIDWDWLEFNLFRSGTMADIDSMMHMARMRSGSTAR